MPLADAVLGLVFGFLDYTSCLTGAKLTCRNWSRVPAVMTRIFTKSSSHPGMLAWSRLVIPAHVTCLFLGSSVRGEWDKLARELLLAGTLFSLRDLSIVCDLTRGEQLDKVAQALTSFPRLRSIFFSFEVEGKVNDPPELPLASLPLFDLFDATLMGLRLDGFQLAQWPNLRQLDLESSLMTVESFAHLTRHITGLEKLHTPRLVLESDRDHESARWQWPGSRLTALTNLSISFDPNANENEEGLTAIVSDLISQAATTLQVLDLGETTVFPQVAASVILCSGLRELSRERSLYGDMYDDNWQLCVLPPDWQGFRHLVKLDLNCSDIDEFTFELIFGHSIELKNMFVRGCDFLTSAIVNLFPALQTVGANWTKHKKKKKKKNVRGAAEARQVLAASSHTCCRGLGAGSWPSL